MCCQEGVLRSCSVTLGSNAHGKRKDAAEECFEITPRPKQTCYRDVTPLIKSSAPIKGWLGEKHFDRLSIATANSRLKGPDGWLGSDTALGISSCIKIQEHTHCQEPPGGYHRFWYQRTTDSLFTCSNLSRSTPSRGDVEQ